MENNNHFQLFIIGAGPAGYSAAVEAAKLGHSVAIADYSHPGGTCLNRGCIPTKTLMGAAGGYYLVKNGGIAGLLAENINFDYAAIHARVNEVVDKLRTGVEGLLKGDNITFVKGRAIIESPGRVMVGEKLFTCDKILIATGSRPALPPIPGANNPEVLTSDGALARDLEPYQRIVIVGGGVIGAEFASVYANLGRQVTIVEAAGRILPLADVDISKNLAVALKKLGVKIMTSATLGSIDKNPDGTLICHVTTGDKSQEIETDGVLIAVGRKPNTDGLFADDISKELGDIRAGIPVSAEGQTPLQGIYAAGDVTAGGFGLAHFATAQGVNAVRAMFGKAPVYNLEIIPSCLYTDPEIAWVGLTEEEAAAKGINVITGKHVMHSNGRTIIENTGRSLIKLVFNRDTLTLIGAQLMCARATDIISELTTAIVSGLSPQQLLAAVRPHPTFEEAVTEAVLDAFSRLDSK